MKTKARSYRSIYLLPLFSRKYLYDRKCIQAVVIIFHQAMDHLFVCRFVLSEHAIHASLYLVSFFPLQVALCTVCVKTIWTVNVNKNQLLCCWPHDTSVFVTILVRFYLTAFQNLDFISFQAQLFLSSSVTLTKPKCF